MKEGAKIVASKAFCPLNFRITDRNLSGKCRYLLTAREIDMSVLISLCCEDIKYSSFP